MRNLRNLRYEVKVSQKFIIKAKGHVIFGAIISASDFKYHMKLMNLGPKQCECIKLIMKLLVKAALVFRKLCTVPWLIVLE